MVWHRLQPLRAGPVRERLAWQKWGTSGCPPGAMEPGFVCGFLLMGVALCYQPPVTSLPPSPRAVLRLPPGVGWVGWGAAPPGPLAAAGVWDLGLCLGMWKLLCPSLPVWEAPAAGGSVSPAQAAESSHEQAHTWALSEQAFSAGLCTSAPCLGSGCHSCTWMTHLSHCASQAGEGTQSGGRRLLEGFQ